MYFIAGAGGHALRTYLTNSVLCDPPVHCAAKIVVSARQNKWWGSGNQRTLTQKTEKSAFWSASKGPERRVAPATTKPQKVCIRHGWMNVRYEKCLHGNDDEFPAKLNYTCFFRNSTCLIDYWLPFLTRNLKVQNSVPCVANEQSGYRTWRNLDFKDAPVLLGYEFLAMLDGCRLSLHWFPGVRIFVVGGLYSKARSFVSLC